MDTNSEPVQAGALEVAGAKSTKGANEGDDPAMSANKEQGQ